ncbi:MAG: hypothetical protein ABFS28_11630 [Bacteroidota bacterium]
MIHRLVTFVLILSIILPGCLNEPDPPLPDSIRSYFILYNFLSESYDVHWDINEIGVESSQAYGLHLPGFSTLEEIKEDVLFSVKEAGSMRVIRSDTFTMEQNHYYIVSIMGTEQEPYILFEPMDLDAPSTGMVRLRLMQTAMEMGPVDLYIGGSTPDHKVISGIAYTDISDYIEASEEELWEAIIITPFGISPADSTILLFTANDVFTPNYVYLGVVGHVTNSPSSTLHLLLYDQPVGL